MTAEEAQASVQQVVYTLQAYAQQRLPVEFTTAGGPVDQVLGTSTDGPVPAEAPLEALSHVNLTTPDEGQPVSGKLPVEGVASSFEGNVPWEVRSGGEVVQEGFATADGYLDRLYPWSAEVDVSALDPGTYTFAAMTSDPSDGEGAGPTEDTKTIRVE